MLPGNSDLCIAIHFFSFNHLSVVTVHVLHFPFSFPGFRRYTQLWLPLIVERANAGHGDALVGPLDVEWLSHTHRLVRENMIE